MIKKTDKVLDILLASVIISAGFAVSGLLDRSDQGVIIISLGIIVGYLGDISRDLKRIADDKED